MLFFYQLRNIIQVYTKTLKYLLCHRKHSSAHSDDFLVKK